MKLIPLGDHVVVRRRVAESTTPAGIVLPESAKKESLEGEVVAIGVGVPENTLSLCVGAKVVFAKYAGTEVTVGVRGCGSETLLVLKLEDIIGVLLD